MTTTQNQNSPIGTERVVRSLEEARTADVRSRWNGAEPVLWAAKERLARDRAHAAAHAADDAARTRRFWQALEGEQHSDERWLVAVAAYWE